MLTFILNPTNTDGLATTLTNTAKVSEKLPPLVLETHPEDTGKGLDWTRLVKNRRWLILKNYSLRSWTDIS